MTADVFSSTKRSAIMSRVRSTDNVRTELALIAVFRKHNITGWQRHQKVFGNPDFVFRRQHVALFVDGCFWHDCRKHGSLPATNRTFWKEKLERNVARDRTVTRELRRSGWRVLRIWQHELIRKNEVRCVQRIRDFLAASVCG